MHSKAGASFAVVCLILGLLGMSYHSSPKSKVALLRSSSFSSLEMSPPKVKVDRERSRSQTPTRTESFGDLHVSSSSGYGTVLPIRSRIKAGESMSNSLNDDSLHSANDDEILVLRGDDKSSAVAPIDATGGSQNVNFLGRKLPKRTYGIILAGAFGLWGGSIMVPMKLAPSNVQGAHFLLSFSIGSSIVTLLFWAVRYLYYVYQYQSLSEAYDALPSFHLRVMWVAGGTSGLLWSIGNFFNLITVFYLGQGVGYPVVQSSMLVSGLWGIFYFKEVQGFKRISMWILSSLVTIYGIVLISYEHVDN